MSSPGEEGGRSSSDHRLAVISSSMSSPGEEGGRSSSDHRLAVLVLCQLCRHPSAHVQVVDLHLVNAVCSLVGENARNVRNDWNVGNARNAGNDWNAGNVDGGRDVELVCARALRALAEDPQVRGMLAGTRVMEVLARLLAGSDATVVRYSADAIADLALGDLERERLGRLGACETLVVAAGRTANARTLQSLCGAAANLALSDDNRSALVGSGLLEVVAEMLGSPEAALRRQAVRVIANLVVDDRVRAAFAADGAATAKLVSFTQLDDEELQCNAVLALANLAVADAGSPAAAAAAAARHHEAEPAVMSNAVLRALMGMTTSANTEVRRTAAGVFAILSASPVHHARLVSLGVVETLVGLAFATDDVEIRRHIAGALANMAATQAVHEDLVRGGALRALQSFLVVDDVKLQRNGLAGLANLALTASVAHQIVAFGQLEAVLDLHNSGPEVQRQLVRLLVALSAEPALRSALIEAGVLDTLRELRASEDPLVFSGAEDVERNLHLAAAPFEEAGGDSTPFSQSQQSSSAAMMTEQEAELCARITRGEISPIIDFLEGLPRVSAPIARAVAKALRVATEVSRNPERLVRAGVFDLMTLLASHTDDGPALLSTAEAFAQLLIDEYACSELAGAPAVIAVILGLLRRTDPAAVPTEAVRALTRFVANGHVRELVLAGGVEKVAHLLRWAERRDVVRAACLLLCRMAVGIRSDEALARRFIDANIVSRVGSELLAVGDSEALGLLASALRSLAAVCPGEPLATVPNVGLLTRIVQASMTSSALPAGPALTHALSAGASFAARPESADVLIAAGLLDEAARVISAEGVPSEALAEALRLVATVARSSRFVQAVRDTGCEPRIASLAATTFDPAVAGSAREAAAALSLTVETAAQPPLHHRGTPHHQQPLPPAALSDSALHPLLRIPAVAHRTGAGVRPAEEDPELDLLRTDLLRDQLEAAREVSAGISEEARRLKAELAAVENEISHKRSTASALASAIDSKKVDSLALSGRIVELENALREASADLERQRRAYSQLLARAEGALAVRDANKEVISDLATRLSSARSDLEEAAASLGASDGNLESSAKLVEAISAMRERRNVDLLEELEALRGRCQHLEAEAEKVKVREADVWRREGELERKVAHLAKIEHDDRRERALHEKEAKLRELEEAIKADREELKAFWSKLNVQAAFANKPHAPAGPGDDVQQLRALIARLRAKKAERELRPSLDRSVEELEKSLAEARAARDAIADRERVLAAAFSAEQQQQKEQKGASAPAPASGSGGYPAPVQHSGADEVKAGLQRLLERAASFEGELAAARERVRSAELALASARPLHDSSQQKLRAEAEERSRAAQANVSEALFALRGAEAAERAADMAARAARAAGDGRKEKKKRKEAEEALAEATAAVETARRRLEADKVKAHAEIDTIEALDREAAKTAGASAQAEAALAAAKEALEKLDAPRETLKRSLEEHEAAAKALRKGKAKPGDSLIARAEDVLAVMDGKPVKAAAIAPPQQQPQRADGDPEGEELRRLWADLGVHEMRIRELEAELDRKKRQDATTGSAKDELDAQLAEAQRALETEVAFLRSNLSAREELQPFLEDQLNSLRAEYRRVTGQDPPSFDSNALVLDNERLSNLVAILQRDLAIASSSPSPATAATPMIATSSSSSSTSSLHHQQLEQLSRTKAEVAGLGRWSQELEAELKDLTQAAQVQRGHVSSLKERVAGARASVEDARREVGELEGALAGLAEERRSALASRDVLEAEARAARGAADEAEAARARAEVQVRELEQASARARSEAAEAERRAVELRALSAKRSAEAEGTFAEIRRLEMLLEAIAEGAGREGAQLEALRRRAAELEAASSESSAELLQRNTQLSAMSERLDATRAKVKALEDELVARRSELLAAESRRDELHEEIAEHEAAARRCNEENTGVLVQLSRQTSSLEKIRASKLDVEARLARMREEAASFEADLAQMEARTAEARRQTGERMEAISAGARRLRELQVERDAVEADAVQVEASVRQALGEMDALRARHSAARERVAAVTAENASLRADAGRLASEASLLETEAVSLRAELRDKVAALQAAQTEAHRARDAHEDARLRLVSLETMVQRSTAEAQAALETAASLEETYQRRAEEAKAAKRDLANVREDIASMEVELAEAAREASVVSGRRSELDIELSGLRRELKGSEERAQGLRQALAHLKAQIAERAHEIADAEEEWARLTRRIEDSVGDLAAVKAGRQAAEEEAAKLESEIVEAQLANQEARAKLPALKSRLFNASSERASTEADVQRLAAQVDATVEALRRQAEATKATLTRKIADEQEDLGVAEQRLAQLADANSAKRARYLETQARIAELQRQADEDQLKLDSATRQLRDMASAAGASGGRPPLSPSPHSPRPGSPLNHSSSHAQASSFVSASSSVVASASSGATLTGARAQAFVAELSSVAAELAQARQNRWTAELAAARYAREAEAASREREALQGELLELASGAARKRAAASDAEHEAQRLRLMAAERGAEAASELARARAAAAQRGAEARGAVAVAAHAREEAASLARARDEQRQRAETAEEAAEEARLLVALHETRLRVLLGVVETHIFNSAAAAGGPGGLSRAYVAAARREEQQWRAELSSLTVELQDQENRAAMAKAERDANHEALAKLKVTVDQARDETFSAEARAAAQEAEVQVLRAQLH
jgi:chromosome segregation ATPase